MVNWNILKKTGKKTTNKKWDKCGGQESFENRRK